MYNSIVEIFVSAIAALILAVFITQTYTEKGVSKSDTISVTEEPTSLPTPLPSVSPSPKSQTSQNQNMNEYLYPGSKIISSSSQNLVLTSGDAPEKITSWYKEVIQGKNLNINSFVNTQANDKILNELVGDNGQISIKVEVSKETVSAPVKIIVGVTSK